MELLRASVMWVRGEIFEMTLVAASGAALAIAGLACWRFGMTPLAKSLFVPLVVLGLLYGAIGVSGYIANQGRIAAFDRAHADDPRGFAVAEKARIEGFQYMYTITNVVAPIAFAAAALLFWLTLDARARASAIALMLFGLMGLVIDGFSKERADRYYARVLIALSAPTMRK